MTFNEATDEDVTDEEVIGDNATPVTTAANDNNVTDPTPF
jgi:hypothetical protein